mmetsp:Transcript_43390/g.112882  ORF Transcript_43390/g.112882 Transcript_43390/m.112882 type:complete len:103 (+) Transcript_43390:1818-2126(+)
MGLIESLTGYGFLLGIPSGALGYAVSWAFTPGEAPINMVQMGVAAVSGGLAAYFFTNPLVAILAGALSGLLTNRDFVAKRLEVKELGESGAEKKTDPIKDQP